MKRSIVAVLAVVMLCAMASPALAAPAPMATADVTVNQYWSDVDLDGVDEWCEYHTVFNVKEPFRGRAEKGIWSEYLLVYETDGSVGKYHELVYAARNISIDSAAGTAYFDVFDDTDAWWIAVRVQDNGSPGSLDVMEIYPVWLGHWYTSAYYGGNIRVH